MAKPIVRQCNKKYLDGDCPDGVLCILDDPRYGDRYSVIYSEVLESNGVYYMWGRGMSEDPFHPQGIGMSFELKVHEVRNYRHANRHRYTKWSSLPEKVKQCVRRDLEKDD